MFKFIKAFIIFDCIFYESIGVYCISQGDIGYIPLFMIGMLFVSIKIYKSYILEKEQTVKYICLGVAVLVINLICLCAVMIDDENITNTTYVIFTLLFLSVVPIMIIIYKRLKKLNH